MEYLGIIFIVILGGLSHFLYEWTNHNKFVAYFCAVNESTWEHIKLALGPAFLWLIIELPFIGQNTNFLLAKSLSILVMTILIPILFYSYSKILNKHILIIDILIFIVSVVIGQLLSAYILTLPGVPFILNYTGLIILIIIFIMYMTKTFLPDKNFLYKDPITNKYGLSGHSHETHKKK